MSAAFFQPDGDGVRLTLRITPRARRAQITGPIEAGGGRSALAVKLAAPPVEGAANEALIALLAEELGVGRSALTILSGEKSRLKVVRVADCRMEAIEAWAARWPS